MHLEAVSFFAIACNLGEEAGPHNGSDKVLAPASEASFSVAAQPESQWVFSKSLCKCCFEGGERAG